MEITWLGHSSFRLRGKNVNVLMDPKPLLGQSKVVKFEPKVVTVSNSHPDHSCLNYIEGDYRLLEGPGEYAVSGVYVRGIMTSPASEDPGQRRNTAYFVEIDGLRICHLGDISTVLSEKQVDELTPVDILFLPVGGNCTLGLDHLSGTINALDPKIVVPMHYKTLETDGDLNDLSGFLKEMGVREPDARPHLSVTDTSLPGEITVVVLKASDTCS